MLVSVVGSGQDVKGKSRQQRRAEEWHSQKGYERRVWQEAGLAERMDAASRQAVETVVQEEVEAREAGVLGRDKGEHRHYNDASEGEATCRKCGSRQRVMFTRDGGWRRNLVTLYGVVSLRLSRVRCDCGGFVSVEHRSFKPYARRQADVDAHAQGLMGMCLSLRQTRLVLGMRGIQVSTKALAGRVREIADRSQEQFGKENPAPGVVLLDALWAHMAFELGGTAENSRQQERKRKRVKKRPLLIAWGIWPDTGRAGVVGYLAASAEDQESWERLLEDLRQRGVVAKHGLRLFVHDGCGALGAALAMVSFAGVRRQRCIFHKIRNVIDAVQGEAQGTAREKREKKKARRQEVLVDLVAIWVSLTAEQARQKQMEFLAKWQESEPGAMAKLADDFEATLTYYAVQAEVRKEGKEWEARYLRTTSPLERRNRAIRAKFRSAVIFQSEEGMVGAAKLALLCRGTEDPGELLERLRGLRAAQQAV